MTARQIIDRVNEIKPNAFTDAVKLAWLNELEGRVAAEVLLMPPAEIKGAALTMTSVPLVDPPYDDMYVHWLEARIDESNGEYSKYQNTMQRFNACFSEFVCWFCQTWDPAQGYVDEERRKDNGTL